MIRHIVLWKLNEAIAAEEKEATLKEMEARLNGLHGAITELKSLSVSVNAPEVVSGNFDIMLDATFDSIDALNAYQVHPKHVEVGGYIKSLNLQRACIDFEF